MKHIRSNPILFTIITVSIALRIVAAIILGDQVEAQPGIFDQVSYHNLALRVLSGHGFTFDQEWWPITKAGEPTAHWSYLYTGYLVVVYKIFGVNPLLARVIQAVASGLLMPWLVYRITKRVFSAVGKNENAIALIASGWVSVYGYLVYYAGALMTETFYIIGLLWIFDTSMRIREKVTQDTNLEVHPRYFLILGLAISVTALLRQVFLPFVPLLFLWLFLVFLQGKNFWPALRSMLGGVIYTLVVFVLLIGPITFHNYQKFGSFVLVNTNAGYAFFWSNHPVHGNSFVPLFTPDMPTYQELIPFELRHLNEARLDNELMKLAVQEILNNPVRYLRLVISRIPAHFIFWPLPASGLLSNVVRVFSLGIALPFMIAGFISWLRMAYLCNNRSILDVFRSNGMLLLFFIAEYTMIHLASWAGIRYRLIQDVPALIFAAYPLFFLLMHGRNAISSIPLRSKTGAIDVK